MATSKKIKKAQDGYASSDQTSRLKSYDGNYKTKFEWKKGESEPSKITERRTLKGLLKGAPKAKGKLDLKSKPIMVEDNQWSLKAKNGKAVAKDGKWIQKATASIKRRGTEGKCTPITKPGCTGKAKALAKTFKKMAKARKGK
jgi:hypothetical protein